MPTLILNLNLNLNNYSYPYDLHIWMNSGKISLIERMEQDIFYAYMSFANSRYIILTVYFASVFYPAYTIQIFSSKRMKRENEENYKNVHILCHFLCTWHSFFSPFLLLLLSELCSDFQHLPGYQPQ